MKKVSRTVRHVLNPTFSDGTVRQPPNAPTFASRLGWKMGPKAPINASSPVKSIANADGAFFCDANIFDVTTDNGIWTALLNSSGKCVLIPEVLEELQAWLRSHSNHPGTKALAAGHEGFCIAEENNNDAAYANSYAYYVNLLALRKRLPTLYSAPEIQQRFGERAALLAKKAKGSPRSRTFYTDESLVYRAVSSAIYTGRHTVILTKDEDVQEQFYKLIFLLDTQYRGMLLADVMSSASQVSPFAGCPWSGRSRRPFGAPTTSL